mmetsp:Transcript_6091/g.18043  ORF Transcript_6091/g.18043 Transcript_6091/m.18043 type:complete len:254 (-) Transcript_6091:672-1433(-)
MTGTPWPAPRELSRAMNLRPRNVVPSWLLGLRRISLGFARPMAASRASAVSSPLQTSARPPMRSSRASVTSEQSCISVAPSGTAPPGLQSTPIGTSKRTRSRSAAAAVSCSSKTTASMLFQSFWMSPSFRSRRPKRSQRPASSSGAISAHVAAERTEPSTFRGTSSGKSHFRRLNWPSRRPLFSSKASTPLPCADSATPRKALHGLASYSGSSVSDTRMVSPMPSSSSAPMPTADLMRPSAPPPASVTPRCKG